MTLITCPVCESHTKIFDVVDFNKSCEEPRGKFLPLSGKPVYYSQCQNCSFTFAPEFKNWSDEDFLANIYNEKYVEVDPDYVNVRPASNFELINKTFGEHRHGIRHLDYGGGNGKLSDLLKSDGWNSQTYDPFPKNETDPSSLGKFNLITAFEVFEHVPDVNRLLRDLVGLMDASCLIIFSTLILDGNINKNERLNWWYASPRNGHISLFSSKSLALLGQKNKIIFGSFGPAYHFYLNQLPKWAKHIIK